MALACSMSDGLACACRFNAIQAILLDILLVLPRLVETIFSPPTSGLAKQLYINANSVIWVAITGCVVYAMANCFMGHYGRIPFVSDAADDQVR